MLHVIFRRSRVLGIVVLVLMGIALVLGLLAERLTAQPQPSITYVYLRGSDTVGVEVITQRADAISGSVTMRGQPRMEWEQSHRDQAPTRLALRAYAPGASATDAPAQQFNFVVRGDSVQIEQLVGGNTRTQGLAVKTGTVAVVGSSVLHLSVIANYARASGRSTLPVFNVAGGQQSEATVAFVGDTSTMTLSGLAIRTVWKNGAPTEVSVPAQGVRVVRSSGTVTAPSSAPVVIDYSAPTSAPYSAEDVVIPTPAGHSLAGTLTRPKGSAKVPVVITISGSGPQDRDSRIAPVPGYQIFRQVADTLGRRGIAVLRYDDRGVGQSGGRESVATATSADLADDVRAVVAWLRTRPDIDGSRIALAGHSEGGLIAPMVAATDTQIAAIALLAGTAYRGRSILMFQNRQVIDQAAGLSPAQRDSIFATVPAQLDTLGQRNAWMNYFMSYDPLPTLRRVRQPVLILQGETDRQVTPEQADTLASAVRGADNRAVTMQRFPAVNHLFLNDASGLPSGYAQLPDKAVRRDVLGALADWMVRTLR